MAAIHTTRYDQLEAQARAFHRAHPEVWHYFCRFTFDLIERGFKHYSAQHGVFARVRWETDVYTTSGSSFKVNNNFSAWYARWFMQAYPEFNGFFRTREQTSQHIIASEQEELRPRNYRRKGGRPAWRPRKPMPIPAKARRRWAEVTGVAA